MKIVLLLLAAFVSQGALAAETCVAQKVTDINYASTVYYQVYCGTEAFSGPTYFQTILLPLPYNAAAAARKGLATLMKSKGYTQAAKITEVTKKQIIKYGVNQTTVQDEVVAFEDSVLVFEKSAPVEKYCGVLQTNTQTIGHAEKVSISDYIVSCSPKAVSETLMGITESELANFMEKLRTKHVLTTKYYGSEARGLLSIYKESN